MIFGLLMASQPLFALTEAELTEVQLAPMETSAAYQQFMRRPTTELSKLIYLIDRFRPAKLEILYGTQYYDTSFAAPFVRAFLATHYKNETAQYWVLHWCSTAIPFGNTIWVRFPNGENYEARKILLDELAALEESLKTVRSKSSHRQTIPSL
ncbi:MAG: hypothetical protein COW12_10895 [Candidatus Omnitrophica bacterium CG12_big_fil_rev_8_21_14_0_65_45_16]|nr:MAG: hypothetical protein COW12_10895 [Candidatus Omnitrophica bacterium CG12_big_fil_rev_8_21_14_0_65_45_16]